MFKRMFLMLTFVAAFGLAGFCVADNADARRWLWRGRPYAAYYHSAPPVYYYPPYRGYYRSYYYGPRYYQSYYPGFYYDGPRARVWVGW
jgi:hypothetical protein